MNTEQKFVDKKSSTHSHRPPATTTLPSLSGILHNNSNCCSYCLSPHRLSHSAHCLSLKIYSHRSVSPSRSATVHQHHKMYHDGKFSCDGHFVHKTCELICLFRILFLCKRYYGAYILKIGSSSRTLDTG